MQESKICQYCGSKFSRIGLISQGKWERRKFCSHACGNKGKDSSHLVKYAFEKGKSFNPATQFTKGSTSLEKNVNWKGDKASYTAKHIWMKTNYGAPKGCERCGTEEDRMYHWANISQQYKRDRADWMRLCVPCHRAYDNGKWVL